MPVVTAENKCDLCVAKKCCTYITQELPTPRSKADFEHFLWQVSHEDVGIYKDEDGWFLLVDRPCMHLGPKGMCKIYDRRPDVCREYSNDFCEYDEPAEKGFELYFPDYDSLRKYCKKRFKRWEK